MTQRELVKAAIDHQVTDRVPYCISFTPDGKDVLREHLGIEDIDAYVNNDVAMINPPWWHWHELAEDWRGFDAPTSPAHVRGKRSYPEFFDNLKRLRDETGKYILVMIYGSHFEKAYISRSIENFLADMACNREFAQKLLTKIIDKNMVMLENILTASEIDGVLLGSDWGSQQSLLMSPATWEEMIRPGEQREYDLIHSYEKDVWVHSCGNIEAVIPSLIEMGLDVLNPVQPEAMDLDTLKTNYGDKLTFWGGVSTQQSLPFGTPEEVRAESHRVRDLLGENGGLIFSPAQEIQNDVPPENMVALLEVAKEGKIHNQ